MRRAEMAPPPHMRGTKTALEGTLMPRFALTAGEDAITTDSLTELVGALIEHYPSSGDETQLLEDRWRCAVLYADAAQARLLAEALGRGELDLAGLSEDQVNLLMTSRAERLAAPDGRWEMPVPLVLIATDFHPYTTVPVPAGNVLLVDPGNERSLIGSLCDLGVCTLYVHGEED